MHLEDVGESEPEENRRGGGEEGVDEGCCGGWGEGDVHESQQNDNGDVEVNEDVDSVPFVLEELDRSNVQNCGHDSSGEAQSHHPAGEFQGRRRPVEVEA